mmetsp:Transcript_104225/g.334346  ORF Transcript_104225/g.334346 Transcript_104225/m.334346 type:complete len:251 (-) Transcript_104225:8-760(-)
MLRTLGQGVDPALLVGQRGLVLLQLPEARQGPLDRRIPDLGPPIVERLLGLLVVSQGSGVLLLASVSLLLAPQDVHRGPGQRVLLVPVQGHLVSAVGEGALDGPKFHLGLRVQGGGRGEFADHSLNPPRCCVKDLRGVEVRPHPVDRDAVLRPEVLVQPTPLLQQLLVAILAISELSLKGVDLGGGTIHGIEQRRHLGGQLLLAGLELRVALLLLLIAGAGGGARVRGLHGNHSRGGRRGARGCRAQSLA